jgi:glycosyltransferase involved in cell wall biosynthesis
LICNYFQAVFRDRDLLPTTVGTKCSTVAIPHISDMNALLDLAGDNPVFCNQSALPAKGFDDNIHSSLNGFFTMEGAIKSLRLDVDGIPRAKRNSDGADVPFHFLHFQGRAKDLMANFAWPVTESSSHHSLRIHMEDIDTRTDIETEIAMLRRRIAALEHDVRNLRETVTPLVRRSWRAKFTPRLYQWVQYEPREVVELTADVTEMPLPSPAPRIAIVTPSYNYAEFLGATAMSVIMQSYPNLTYVVQDNNSTDGTAKLLAEITHRDLMQEPRRLIVRGEADRGQADAINRGFAQAPDADLMGYLNADDILLPGTLSFVAGAFRRYPHIDVVYGHRIFIDADSWETGRCVLPNHDRDAIRWMDYIPQETMFWRRRVWERIGPLDESLRYAIDWDFILRAHDAGFRFKRLPRFLACFRWHDKQKTSALLKVGADEQKRLRRRHLGYDPTGKEIGGKIKGYLRRHVLFHRAYKLRLLGI